MQMNELISTTQLNDIQKNFNKLLRKGQNLKYMRRLPAKNYYLPIIVDCYNQMFYSRGRRPITCPGPLMCKIPPIQGLKCNVAERQYRHANINWRTKFYLANGTDKFRLNHNGCTL